MAFTKLQELRRGFVVPLGAGGPAADDQEAVRPTPTRGVGVQFGSFGHWAIPLRLARTRCDDCYSPERWIIDLTTLTTHMLDSSSEWAACHAEVETAYVARA